MILREMLEKSPGILPEDKQRLDGVMSEFQGLIKENLSAAPGEGMQKQMQGQAPIQTGGKAVAPAI